MNFTTYPQPQPQPQPQAQAQQCDLPSLACYSSASNSGGGGVGGGGGDGLGSSSSSSSSSGSDGSGTSGSVSILGESSKQYSESEFQSFPRIMKEGDLVVCYERHDSMDHIYLEAGKIFNNKFGNFHHNDFVRKIPVSCDIVGAYRKHLVSRLESHSAQRFRVVVPMAGCMD
jgi:hypothetical protein